jgi:hypothetical protein
VVVVVVVVLVVLVVLVVVLVVESTTVVVVARGSGRLTGDDPSGAGVVELVESRLVDEVVLDVVVAIPGAPMMSMGVVEPGSGFQPTGGLV